jgi:hypothetical protein
MMSLRIYWDLDWSRRGVLEDLVGVLEEVFGDFIEVIEDVYVL